MEYSRRLQVAFKDEEFKYKPVNSGCAVVFYSQSWIEIPPMEGVTIRIPFDVNIPLGFMGYVSGADDLGVYGVLYNNFVIPTDGWHRISLSVFNPTKDTVHIGEGEKIAYFTILQGEVVRLNRRRKKLRGRNSNATNAKSNSPVRFNGVGEDNNSGSNENGTGE